LFLAANDLGALRKSRFAHHRQHGEIKRFMNKGERISQFVRGLEGADADFSGEVANHPFYRAYFRCWNDQRYYEAHDVLEQLWLNTDTGDDNFFKGLIQAAGAFVHLQKNFEYPTHPKHSRRLRPAVKLFELAEKNLASYVPEHHGLDVAGLLELLRRERIQIGESDFKINPWSPRTAPALNLSARKD
jgi:predicted metal-dependent hydrolase